MYLSLPRNFSCEYLSKISTKMVYKSITFVLIMITGCLLVLYSYWDWTAPYYPASTSISPVLSESSKLPLFLRDVIPSEDVHNIYQIVTSEMSVLKRRHYCSLESFCLHNPTSTVWQLQLQLETGTPEQPTILQELQQRYSNLQVAGLNLLDSVMDTPLHSILTSGRLDKSKYRMIHTSDVLILAVVSKVGGMYADIDFICLRDVSSLRNYIGLALRDQPANGIFHFEKDHPFSRKVMDEDARTFNGSIWGYNGPLLFMRCAKNLCPQFSFLRGEVAETTDNSSEAGCRREKSSTTDYCQDLKLGDTNDFLPYYFPEMRKLFGPNSSKLLEKRIKNSYAIHLFNGITSKIPILTGKEDSGLGQLVKKHCPIVYEGGMW